MITSEVARKKPNLYKGWTEFRDLIEKREHFTISTKNFRSEPYLTSFGQLPPEYRPSVCVASYVVYSYETPIAWYDDETYTWTIPDVHYSTSTSRHQGIVRTCVSVIDNVYTLV